ncbi:hypothetical protein, partial [Escherichia coli]|uniref:hypothetical protein n=1 Tax=Escherichia coli TaxID=562 RepID=UPI00201D0513
AEKYALIEQWRQQFPIEAMCQVFGVPECIRTPERLAFRLYTQPKRLSLNTMNRPDFPGECFICELRLPDHCFRWK